MPPENEVVEIKNEVDNKPEATEQEEVQSTPKLSESEEKASQLGWMPKEQWVEEGRDESDWKPAKVFLEHGEMIGKIRQQARELAEANNAIRFINEKNKQIYEKGYQSALTELRQQKRAALAEGDLVKADEIDEKIDRTKDELQVVRQQPINVPKQQGPDPEHIEWLQRNPWYNDGVMQKFADAVAMEYINVNKGQVTPADVRDFVEKEVKKEFAHKFNKSARAAPSPDGEGRGSGNRTPSGLDSRLAKAKAELTDEERSIMKTMMRSTGMSEKKYLELYLSN